jgi:thiamine transport system permease protein
LLNRIAAVVGLPPRQYLYGLTGILIAHVFFNLPLAVRLLLPAWQSIPGESWRLAAQLGMRSSHILLYIEWPVLRQSVPLVAGLVFMLCFTSFAVVLTLGGGPLATTVEVAIYQALRFDFDLPRAGLLALLQLFFCGAIVTVLQLLGRTPDIEPLTGVQHMRPDLGGAVACAS